MNKVAQITLILILSLTSATAAGQQKSIIFPLPREMEVTGERFTLDEQTTILVPQHPSENDLKLARSLVRELSDKYGLALGIKHVETLPEDDMKYVIMGVIDNLLINRYCSSSDIKVSMDNPGPEQISFFKRFLRDFMALYKFKKVIIEVNCMRLNRHPEVNAGWIDFAKYYEVHTHQ